MEIACTLRKLKINIFMALIFAVLESGWPGENWPVICLETGWPGKIGRWFGWNLAGPGEIGRWFAWKLAGRGKLAGDLAGIWLTGGNWPVIWLEFDWPGENCDFPWKSEFQQKPPRTTNFHLKDPGIDQLESSTLVTMVMVSCKFDIVHAFQILASKSHFVHFLIEFNLLYCGFDQSKSWGTKVSRHFCTSTFWLVKSTI